MFGKRFGRHGNRWQQGESSAEGRSPWEYGADEGGDERNHGRHPGFGHRHHGPGRGFNRKNEGFPFFGQRGERDMHFAPQGPGRGGPPFRRGGPFGDDPFGGDNGGRQRQRRGDIKFILLELLAEQPRHGYDLIKELEQRYNGFYRPSPGSVYPTLQMLEEEGNLSSELADGKRVYTITEAGRTLIAERKEHEEQRRGGPRGPFGRGKPSAELHDLRSNMMALGASVMQVAQHGTAEQAKAVAEQLEATRRAIYGILAQEQSKSE